VEAHAADAGDARGVVSVSLAALGLDAITQAAPTLPGAGSGGDPGAERGGGEEREQGLVAREGVFVSRGTRHEKAMDAARGAGEHAHHLVGVGRGQREEAWTHASSARIGVDAVECEGGEVEVQVERGAASAQSARCAAERSSAAKR
jgi:hypothetical protein